MHRITLLALAIIAMALSCNNTSPPLSDGGPSDLDTDGDTDSDGDSDSDSDGDSDSDSDTDSDSDGDPGLLSGTIRDFHDSHPDFEGPLLTADPGIVAEDLGTDGKPVYAGGTTGTTTDEEAFDQWYNDVSDINLADDMTVQLEDNGEGVWVYDNQAFFPIDDQLFGNEGNTHNYHFTYEIHTQFTYTGGEEFTFTGDDDLFVFINNKLAIDLGGVHGPLSQTANLDELSEFLEIQTDNVYSLDFFFAERHTVDSHFRIDTTISDLTPIID